MEIYYEAFYENSYKGPMLWNRMKMVAAVLDKKAKENLLKYLSYFIQYSMSKSKVFLSKFLHLKTALLLLRE